MDDFNPAPVFNFEDAPDFNLPASDMDGPPEPTTFVEEDVDLFPDDVSQDVTGLTFMGYLTSSFELKGHRFVIRTLKVGEELACAQLIKEYEETMAQGKAYAIAQIAAAIVTVDGRNIGESLGPDDSLATISNKFDYIAKRWYWPVIEALYDEFSNLMLRQAVAYDALEGKS